MVKVDLPLDRAVENGKINYYNKVREESRIKHWLGR